MTFQFTSSDLVGQACTPAGWTVASTDGVPGRSAGETPDSERDTVWRDLFSNPGSWLNGLYSADDAQSARPTQPAETIPLTTLTPTVPEFINAANRTYSRDAGDMPADLQPFLVDGEQLALEVTDSGFYGAAFLTPLNQVVIAFEGTHLSALSSDPEFVLAQLAANTLIYLGQAPAAYADALDLSRTVLAAAQERGIAADAVFVTGHSLGGAEAAYVAAQLGLAGETFGAPGIPAADVPVGITSELVNYVEYGDPVGNYSANPNRMGGFLYSDDILRYGDPTYVGDPAAVLALEAAGALFGPGTTEADNAAGLGLLAGLAGTYHVLTAYAEDLGVALDNPGAYGDAAGAAGLLTGSLGGVPAAWSLDVRAMA